MKSAKASRQTARIYIEMLTDLILKIPLTLFLAGAGFAHAEFEKSCEERAAGYTAEDLRAALSEVVELYPEAEAIPISIQVADILEPRHKISSEGTVEIFWPREGTALPEGPTDYLTTVLLEAPVPTKKDGAPTLAEAVAREVVPPTSTRHVRTNASKAPSFTEARAYVQKLGIRNHKEYLRRRAAGDLPGYPYQPRDFWRGEYQGDDDFYGRPTEDKPLFFLMWDNARALVREHGIRTQTEYRAFRKTEAGKGLPRDPNIYYAAYWKGWREFLGTIPLTTPPLPGEKYFRWKGRTVYLTPTNARLVERLREAGEAGVDWLELYSLTPRLDTGEDYDRRAALSGTITRLRAKFRLVDEEFMAIIREGDRYHWRE